MRLIFSAAVEMPFEQHDGLDKKIGVDLLCVFFVKCHFPRQICFSFPAFPSTPNQTMGVIIIISASSENVKEKTLESERELLQNNKREGNTSAYSSRS